MRRPTIADVAARAGCSPATASRALSGGGPVSEAARLRVDAAARALGFRLDPLGRALRRGRSGAIGVLAPSLANPVFAEAIEGVEVAAAAAGLTVLVACVGYDAAREAAAAEALIDRRVDGLVMTVADAAASLAVDRARRSGTPCALMFNQPPDGVTAVCVDNRAAAGDVAEAMLAAGRRRLGFVAGRFATSDRSRQRFEGLAAALAEAGARPPELVEVSYADHDHRAALAALFARAPRIDALFCSNDMLALAVIAGLRALGRSVPDDVAVVGFDGVAVGALTQPSLATVVTPTAEMGRAAAGLLLAARAQGRPPAPEALILPHQFRPGESLAGAADPDTARQRQVRPSPGKALRQTSEESET
ncbi:MAG: LacI family DNA-binding transcriptional regulator [Rhodobacteraceae bacterium]|nr:MAG: LacI family DNA-binding transcriptional regulator [Paracoccaceae bacterium]